VLIKVVRVFLLLTAFLILLPSQVQALGVGVSPHKLELEAYPLGSVTSLINVINTSNERSLYQVYVEGDCEGWFSITPAEFVLDSQRSQEVKIAISPSLTASGEYSADICIVSLVSASELKVGCGVKIPVHIRVISPPPLAKMGINVTGPLLLVVVGTVVLLFVALVAGIFIWIRRKTYET
jgi:hypothetical protein